MKTSRKNPIRKPSSERYAVGRGLKARLIGFLIFSAASFVLLGFYVHRVQQENEKAASQYVLGRKLGKAKEIPYRRGDILDRNGTYLTTTEKRYQMTVSPRDLLSPADRDKYYDCTVNALTDFFGLPENELRKQIEENSTSQSLKVGAPLSPEDRLRYLDFKEHINRLGDYEAKKKKEDPSYEGFTEEQKTRYKGLVGADNLNDYYERSYPYGELACNVLGFYRSYDDRRVGVTGIEQYYNSQLSGTDGLRYRYMDASGDTESVTREPQDGNSVVSTIDIKVQQSVERHIKEYMETTGAENIGVIVMNPNNGEILALATNHPFDLNDPGNLQKYYSVNALKQMTSEEATQKLWNNFCVSSIIEPGSTAKIFTIAGALENGVINGNETYNCTGEVDVQGTLIHCNKRTGHGVVDVTGALEQSCNVALVRIAQKLGRENFQKTQNLYGFGVSSGIDLPGEPDT